MRVQIRANTIETATNNLHDELKAAGYAYSRKYAAWHRADDSTVGARLNGHAWLWVSRHETVVNDWWAVLNYIANTTTEERKERRTYYQ